MKLASVLSSVAGPKGFKTKFHYNKDWNLSSFISLAKSPSALRPNSTITRIETSREKERLFWFWSLRPNSTITRIETGRAKSACNYLQDFKTKFHYNKDWNKKLRYSKSKLLHFKTKFHYNKDWNKQCLKHQPKR